MLVITFNDPYINGLLILYPNGCTFILIFILIFVFILLLVFIFLLMFVLMLIFELMFIPFLLISLFYWLLIDDYNDVTLLWLIVWLFLFTNVIYICFIPGFLEFIICWERLYCLIIKENDDKAIILIEDLDEMILLVIELIEDLDEIRWYC